MRREFDDAQYSKARWTPERRELASRAARRRQRLEFDMQANKIFDPKNRLNRLEKVLLSRVAISADKPASYIAAKHPMISQDLVLFTFTALEKSGLIKRNSAADDSMMRNGWRLTGCGQLFVALTR